MITILLAWCIWIPIFTGIGILIFKYLFPGSINGERICNAFWIGWLGAVGFLQVWNLFSAVNMLSFILVIVIGMTGWVASARETWRWLKTLDKFWWLPGLTALGLGLYLANLASANVQMYDTGLYHLQALQWAKQFPVVPGLGLINYRLAFNNSSMLYNALLDHAVWEGETQHLVSGLLVWAFTLTCLFKLSKFYVIRANIGPAVYYAVMLPNSVLLASNYIYVGFSPDIPVYILGAVLGGLVYQAWTDTCDSREARQRLMMIAWIAASGITVKLSFLVLAAAAMALAVIASFWKNRTLRIKDFSQWLLPSGLIFAFFVIPWVIRGYILSGYPFFPATELGLPFEWRLPVVKGLDATAWIRSWARQPDTHWVHVLFNTAWIPGWVSRLSADWLSSLKLLAAVSLAGILLFSADKTKNARLNWVLLAMPLAAMVYWFCEAPDVRFAGSAFAMVTAFVFAISAENLSNLDARPSGNFLLLTFILVGVWMYVNPISFNLIRTSLSLEGPGEGWLQAKGNYVETTTSTGLVLNLPGDQSEQCWDIPIPCTTNYPESIALNQPGSLRTGFHVVNADEFLAPDIFRSSAGMKIEGISGVAERETQDGLAWVDRDALFSLVTPRAGAYTLQLSPAQIGQGDQTWPGARITILLDEEITTKVDIQAGAVSELVLALSKGPHSLSVHADPIDAQNNTLQENQDSLKIGYSWLNFAAR